MYKEAKAIWNKASISENGEQIRSDVRGETFDVCEYQPTKKSLRSLGIASIDNVILFLRTDSACAEQMKADDTIIYKGNSYSIQDIQGVRSSARLNAREYIICLH